MQSLRNGDLPAWGRRADGGGRAGGAAVALAENPRLYQIFLGIGLRWLVPMVPARGCVQVSAAPVSVILGETPRSSGLFQSLSDCLSFIKAIKPPALLLNTEKVPPMR